MSTNELKTLRKTNEILNLDHFQRAAAEYVNSYLRSIRGFKYAVKLTSDEGRYLIAMKHASLIICPRSEEERTARVLQVFAMEKRIADKSRVSTWLALAHLAGYVTIKRSENDRRMKLYYPTEQYLQITRSLFGTYSTALGIIDPARYGYITASSDEFIGEVSREGVDVYLNGRRIVQTIRNLAIFCAREGGHQLLIRMLEEARLFSDNPSVRICLPFSKVAREFGISRSQVQKTFALIEEAGLVQLLAKGGRDILLTPSFTPFAREVVASFLASAAVSIDNVTQRLQADTELNDIANHIYHTPTEPLVEFDERVTA